jgi:hypothetical protein
VRDIQKGIRRLNLAVQIRTQHHPRISERFDQIDYEESGPLTESNSETKAPLSKEFLVRLCCIVSGHKTLIEIGLEGVARVPAPSAGIVSRFIPCRGMFRHSIHRMESWLMMPLAGRVEDSKEKHDRSQELSDVPQVIKSWMTGRSEEVSSGRLAS